METIIVIEELWLDPMENKHSNATGYKPTGYVSTQDEADALIAEAGFEIGNGWPIKKGDQVPRKRAVVLCNLPPPTRCVAKGYSSDI